MQKIIYFCFAITLLIACKKTEIPAVSIKLDYIAGDVSKAWFVRNAGITFSQNGADRQLILSLDCEGDDRWIFTRDGKLIVNDNFSKCQGQPAERLNTFWSADDTFDNMTMLKWRLRDSGELSDVMFTVSNLTDTTMTLSGGSLITNTKAITINYQTRK